MRPLPAAAILAFSLSLAACATTGGNMASGPAPDASPMADSSGASDALQAAIRGMLRGTARESATDAVAAFYEARGYAPAWSGGRDAEDRAQAARAILARAGEQGLRAGDYESGEDCGAIAEAARCDIALTGAVLGYAHDVRMGRLVPERVQDDIQLPGRKFDAAAELNRALASGTFKDWLAALPPSHPEYLRLAQALAKYRAIADAGGWPSLPGRGEVDPAGKDRRAKLLARRLALEDPILAAIPNASPVQVRDAVKRFQARNAIGADGRVRGATLDALNVTAAARAAQIAANMERWRWMPAQFESRYVAVNVPDQSLAFVEDGQAVLRSPVVVGQKTSPTPILRTEIMAAVVNPPWNIPGDIAARALLPHLRQNPAYLASRNMVVMDGPPGDPIGRTIKWRKIVADDFPYAIRQLPGPGTALGALMLDSPNDFDVYLHDTPNKGLFSRDDREISNGCVRVQKIFPLASLALSGDTAQGLAALTAARKTGATQRLALDRPLPVYFLYWTALAGDDGTVGFRPDLYGRDARLVAALAGNRPASTQGAIPGKPRSGR